MTERTRIMNLQVTIVETSPTYEKMDKKELKKSLAKSIKKALDCDDVIVNDVKDFVLTRKE